MPKQEPSQTQQAPASKAAPRAVLRAASDLRAGDEVYCTIGSAGAEPTRESAQRLIAGGAAGDVVESVESFRRSVDVTFAGRAGAMMMGPGELVVVVEREAVHGGAGGAP
jgi:hypothetical protein